jgi:hypothetical protein
MNSTVNGKNTHKVVNIDQPDIIVGRPAVVEHIPSDDFRERLAWIYRRLEDYILTRGDPSSILEENPEGEGVK